MSNPLKPALLAMAAALALLGASGLAIAAPVDSSAPAAARTVDAANASYLAQAVQQTVEYAPPEKALPQQVLAEPILTERVSLTTAKPQQPIPMHGSVSLALWNLVCVARAQQHGDAFERLETSVALVSEYEREHVSAVPLPGVMWLFVMGVLGLAGAHTTGRRGRKTMARRDTEWADFGAALPA